MRTTDQKRAAHALSQVKELETKGEDHYGKFVSYLSSLPATILTNGLGQAMAMEISAAKDDDQSGHKILYEIVENWLIDHGKVEEDMMEEIMNQNQEFYRLIQAEVLSYLSWLKKFARAYLKEDEG